MAKFKFSTPTPPKPDRFNYQFYPGTNIIDPASVHEIKCIVCKRILPSEKFCVKKTAKLGYNNKCAKCSAFYSKRKTLQTKLLRGLITEADIPYMVTLPFSLNNEQIFEQIIDRKIPRKHPTLFATNLNKREEYYQVTIKQTKEGQKLTLIPLDPNKPVPEQLKNYSPRLNSTKFEGLMVYSKDTEFFVEMALNYLLKKDIRLHFTEECDI